MSAFDFTGDYPTIDDEDGPDFGDQSLNDRVEYWMNVRGFTREEAEQRVLTDMLDDAA